MNKPKYPIHQCALYKCKTKKKLESLLTIEPGNLKNIQHAIKYHSFDIDKKHTTEKRKITAPDRKLKLIQKRILSLLQRVERPSWLISGEKGKCYIDNGMVHLMANYMLAVDIAKFYDNTNGYVLVATYTNDTITQEVENAPNWLLAFYDYLNI